MVTTKIRTIWTIIRSDHVMVFTKRGDDPVDTNGFGRGGLHDILLIAIQMRKAYANLVAMAEEQAVEAGELHALEELREVIKELENGKA